MGNSRKRWERSKLLNGNYTRIIVLLVVVSILLIGCVQDPTGACTKKLWDSFAGEWVYTCLGNMTYEECQNDYQQWGQVVNWEEDRTCWESCPLCDNIFED